jgi:glutathione S-transferase
MLKIWGRVNSINVQKVMWTVAELKIPHERVDAGMAFGVVNTPEYRALNPNGRVPTIDYDGFVLWESNVIVRYLYAKHGPVRTLEEGYGAEKWMDWTATTLAAPMTTVKIADDVLARQPYLSGRELSMGDVPFGCYVNRWMNLPIERPAHANLLRYYDRLKSRAAFQKQVMIPLS